MPAKREFRYSFIIDGDEAGATKSIKKTKEEVTKLDKATDDARKGTKKWREESKRNNVVLGKAKSLVIGLAGAAGIGLLINKFKEISTQSELLKGQLVTMTGSTEKAGLAFSKLEEFAKTTPFTLDQSVQGFVKLTALGLTPSERALRSYGNTASAMGKDLNQMVEAVADAATMEFERLKEFGIKARQQADTVSFTFQGVTTTVAKEAGAIEEFLTGIGENNFGDAMANQMERLPGMLSNLQDNVDNLFRTMGDTGGLSALETVVKLLSTGVEFLTFAIHDAQKNWGIALAQMHSRSNNFKANMKIVAITMAATWNTATANIGYSFDVILASIGGAWSDLIGRLRREFGGFLGAMATGMEKLPGGERMARGIRGASDALITAADNAKGMKERLLELEVAYSTSGATRAAETKSLIADVKEERDVINARQEIVIEGMRRERDAVVENTVALEDLADTNEVAVSTTVELTTAQQGLIDKLFPLRAQTKAYQDDMKTLNGLYEEGAPEYAQALENLKLQYIDLFPEQKRHIEQIELQQKTYDNMIESVQKKLADMLETMSFSFKGLFETITGLWKKMLSEMASKKIMDVFQSGGAGAGGGGGAFNPMNLLGGGLKGMMASGGQFLGGLTNGAIGTNSMVATGASNLGASLNAFITSPAGIAAGVLIAGKLIHDKTSNPDGYTRSNAGFLTANTPGATNTFGVDPFASGFKAQGFANRTSQEEAVQVIDTFRALDSTITELVKGAGGLLDLSKATLAGVNGDGQGGTSGTFLGQGGKTNNIKTQLDFFARQLVDHIGGLTSADLNRLQSASTVEDIVSTLQGITAKQEEVVSAQETLIDNEQKLLDLREKANTDMFDQLLGFASGIIDPLKKSISELKSAIRSDILKVQGVSELFPGSAPNVEAQIERLQQLRQIALANHAEQINIEQELHSRRTSAAAGLMAFVTNSKLGSTSALSHGDQLALAQGNFRTLLSKAKGGDLGAAEGLAGAGEQYINAGQSNFASSSRFKDIFNEVIAGSEAVAASIGPTTPFNPTVANNKLIAELQRINAQLNTLPSQLAVELAPLINSIVTSGLSAGVSPRVIANRITNLGPEAVAAGNESFGALGIGTIAQNANSLAEVAEGAYAITDQHDNDLDKYNALKAVAVENGIDIYRVGDSIGMSREAVDLWLNQRGFQPFANGGIVTGPTLGLLGEAGISEAVIPLRRPGGVMENAPGSDRMTSELQTMNKKFSDLINIVMTDAEFSSEQRSAANRLLRENNEALDEMKPKQAHGGQF